MGERLAWERKETWGKYFSWTGHLRESLPWSSVPVKANRKSRKRNVQHLRTLQLQELEHQRVLLATGHWDPLAHRAESPQAGLEASPPHGGNSHRCCRLLSTAGCLSAHSSIRTRFYTSPLCSQAPDSAPMLLSAAPPLADLKGGSLPHPHRFPWNPSDLRSSSVQLLWTPPGPPVILL